MRLLRIVTVLIGISGVCATPLVDADSASQWAAKHAYCVYNITSSPYVLSQPCAKAAPTNQAAVSVSAEQWATLHGQCLDLVTYSPYVITHDC